MLPVTSNRPEPLIPLMRASKSQRQARILSELDRAPSLRVGDLADRLEVSTETIRRDLDELTEQGLVDRTYGGAVRPLGREPAVSERHLLMVAERQRIARATVPLLASARVIMIGSGSTTEHVARAIAAEMKSVTVITHAIRVATALAVNPGITVVMAPGEFNLGEGAMVGIHTATFLGGFFADVAVLGASGLTEDGPNDALIECGAVYGMIARRAARTVVVADHTKFDKVFPARYAGWPEISHLVTDEAPEGPLAEHLGLSGVEVVMS